jgi:peroxiredoxin
MNAAALGSLLGASALLLIISGNALAADEPATRAMLLRVEERQPALELVLKDSSGKPVSLSKWRGKVVLLDFWATWCTGCKKEIPWFSEFYRAYRHKGLAVAGVSMDDGGWKVVRPFLAHAKVPYPMLLGDEATAQRYGITSMPDTFLIDREGRVAAVYRGGLIDRDNVEANIRKVLSAH